MPYLYYADATAAPTFLVDAYPNGRFKGKIQQIRNGSFSSVPRALENLQGLATPGTGIAGSGTAGLMESWSRFVALGYMQVSPKPAWVRNNFGIAGSF